MSAPLLFAITAASGQSNGAMIAIVLLLVAAGAWYGLSVLIRGVRAGRADAVVHGDFTAFALEALVNAAKIDGRVTEAEIQAIGRAMREIAGQGFEAEKVNGALASARLGKEELIAFLGARSATFDRTQKLTLLKALMNVFVADGAFDEGEHHALVEYTAAVGFDRASAPQMLRRIAEDFRRGNIT